MAEKQSKASPKPTAVPVKRVTPSVAPAREHSLLWPVSAWEREVDRWFDDLRRRMAWPRLWAGPMERVEVTLPAFDVYEQGDDVVVKAEIPGMTKEQIEVSLAGSLLTVTGEKKQEEEVKEKNYYRCERSFGSFSRTVELPAEVKADQAKATFKDGVLEIRIPKTEEAKRKAVTVKVE